MFNFFKKKETKKHKTTPEAKNCVFCSSCGNKVHESSQFCSVCGADMQLKSQENRTIVQLMDSEVFIKIREYKIGQKLYCCVFHHPLRGCAGLMPFGEYPIDFVHIVSNGEFLGNSKVFTDEDEKIIIHLGAPNIQRDIFINATNVETKLDSKVELILPICDAMESWDIIFSHKPIVAEKYLDGYVHWHENVWASKEDLLEKEKRDKELDALIFGNEDKK